MIFWFYAIATSIHLEGCRITFRCIGLRSDETVITFSLVVLVIVGLLLLTVFSGVGVKPIKKIFCPFCGRRIGSAKECPYCGEKVA